MLHESPVLITCHYDSLIHVGILHGDDALSLCPGLPPHMDAGGELSGASCPTCLWCMTLDATPVNGLECGRRFVWWLHPIQLCDTCVGLAYDSANK